MNIEANCVYCSEPVKVPTEEHVSLKDYYAHVECAMLNPYPREIKEQYRENSNASSLINLY